ncbi:hypothetical protein [Haloarcula amylovorans]|uniref:hypothetical protein n=1 Tax=Haloarcula amylovorans TaxID=2562280 RepID=UPI001076AD77|nr:hypothetical protein [Halomicroarcula amylolytica]
MQPPESSYRTTSHRLVTNRDAAPPDAWVRAENAVLGACLDAEMTIELAVYPRLLKQGAPSVAAVFGQLDRVEGRALRGDPPVVHARPTDRKRLLGALSVSATDEVPLWRSQGIYRIAVVDGDEWRYYSVPRKAAIRAVDGPGDDLKAAIRAVIAEIPCTALFPHGALASWTVNDVGIEITTEGLWLGRSGGESRWYPHEKLEGVVADEAACELLLSWPTRRDDAASSLGRLVSGLLDRRRESPPRLLHPPDASTLETAITAYELVADRLCYDFEARRQSNVANGLSGLRR